ncbi:hypothetical protein [Ancylobacter sp. G4_0304]|uniref:hypothetical protein n=1 Tax=Ancylobacter sp. G4_0304 TaxID=3114289 RepID=UPI0039C6D5D7
MKLSSFAVVAVLGLAAAGCVTDAQQPQQTKENLLSAAGFRMRLADTPARVASLKAMPANQFVVKNQNGQPLYLYADPVACGCVFYGNQNAFTAYQQMVFEQRIMNEQEMTAMMNQQAAFDFGVWGDPMLY